MNLSEIFSSVAYKRLVRVDLPAKGSNQHEINGGILRSFFQTDGRVNDDVRWYYFSDDVEPVHETGTFTFYDAREKSSARTGRSEWRLYYSGNFFGLADEGDVLFLVRDTTGGFHGLIFQKDSAWLRAASALFEKPSFSTQFGLFEERDLKRQNIEFLRHRILEEMHFSDMMSVQSSDEEIVVRCFSSESGLRFPPTAEMSELARSMCAVDLADVDSTLIAWLEREERLFRALERLIVQDRLQQGFRTVDEFVSYSLSVQNRRKSRAGQALENHLAALFAANDLKFERTATTEGKSKPDFLFPGSQEYHDPQFDVSDLLMLGSKTTCKDRWRQVLAEADRIREKHLCTLETSISVDQTSEMKRHNLTLVIPDALHVTYTRDQQAQLLNVNQYMQLVASTQVTRVWHR